MESEYFIRFILRVRLIEWQNVAGFFLKCWIIDSLIKGTTTRDERLLSNFVRGVRLIERWVRWLFECLLRGSIKRMSGVVVDFCRDLIKRTVEKADIL